MCSFSGYTRVVFGLVPSRSTQIQVGLTLLFAVLLTGAMKVAPVVLPQVCQTLVVASSSEKSGMLGDFAAEYNAAGHFVNGACVRVRVDAVNSGDAEQALESGWRGAGTPRPDVWSPAAGAWVVLLKERSTTGAAQVPATYETLFQSPLVIGVPQPMANALGYPGRPLGWSDIFGLVNNPLGWGSLGHSEWGRFQLGKTNPNVSTSGLNALIGTYYAAGGATMSTVTSPSVRGFVRGIESAVVHYGPTAREFLANLRDADNGGTALQYVSAVAVEEQELVTYNNAVPGPRIPLVAVYPSEGTPVADHPYVVLQWSTAKAAAIDFYSFVESHQARIDSAFFRDRFGLPGAALSLHSVNTGSIARLTPPEGRVLKTMLDEWQALRKPARVLVLIDTGAGQAAVQAAAQLGAAVTGFQTQDQVGLWEVAAPSAASGHIQVLPLGAPGFPLRSTLSAIEATRARGDLPRAIREGIAALAAGSSGSTIDALLVVEMDPGPRQTLDVQLERDLRNQVPDRQVRLFVAGPPSERLAALALAGRGALYPPGAATHFLRDLVSNF